MPLVAYAVFLRAAPRRLMFPRHAARKDSVVDLLDNPAVQAAAVPFVVALALGFLLAGTRFLVVAVVSGFIVVLVLTIGFSITPMTTVKKLIVVVAAAAVWALVIESAGAEAQRIIVVALAVAAGGAAVWTLWRVLQQLEAPTAWAAAFGAFLLVAVTMGTTIMAGGASSLRAAVTGACLGWGSGAMALIGASALLAQLGLAVGTASAAVALVQLLRKREAPLGWTVVVPTAVAAALIGTLASATGELRWYCLILLPLAPLAARFVPARTTRPWNQAIATGLAVSTPLAAAIGLAWFSAAQKAG